MVIIFTNRIFINDWTRIDSNKHVCARERRDSIEKRKKGLFFVDQRTVYRCILRIDAFSQTIHL